MKLKSLSLFLIFLGSLLAGPVMAADSGSHFANHIARRGDRMANRLDRHANRINRRFDRRTDRFARRH